MLEVLKRVRTFGTDMECSVMVGSKVKTSREMKEMKIGECTELDTRNNGIGQELHRTVIGRSSDGSGNWIGIG